MGVVFNDKKKGKWHEKNWNVRWEVIHAKIKVAWCFEI